MVQVERTFFTYFLPSLLIIILALGTSIIRSENVRCMRNEEGDRGRDVYIRK
jgi:hypothetical protein